MKRLIVTGDDFGLSLHVNEGIERAHRHGILTTASLMVGAEAADDAVARARRLPSLKVGLHLVVVDGRAVLPPRDIPGLVDHEGRFSPRLVRAGAGYFFQPAIRRQLEAEIRAQFDAFRKTGLPLDHVNAHHHMHLHPTVLSLVLNVGRSYGVRAIRLPSEPFLRSGRSFHTGIARRLASALLLGPWLGLMKRRLRRASVRYNDYCFGLQDSGRMTSDRVMDLLARLPDGVSEMYFHPAAPRQSDGHRGAMPSASELELEALMNPAVKEALHNAGIQPVTFSELAAVES